jgi:predicted nuclease with TOPRIM domain
MTTTQQRTKGEKDDL